jgi:hypothetical protein
MATRRTSTVQPFVLVLFSESSLSVVVVVFFLVDVRHAQHRLRVHVSVWPIRLRRIDSRAIGRRHELFVSRTCVDDK